MLSEGLCLESAHAPGLAGEAEQKRRQSRVAAEARTEFGDMQEGERSPKPGLRCLSVHRLLGGTCPPAAVVISRPRTGWGEGRGGAGLITEGAPLRHGS